MDGGQKLGFRNNLKKRFLRIKLWKNNDFFGARTKHTLTNIINNFVDQDCPLLLSDNFSSYN